MSTAHEHERGERIPLVYVLSSGRSGSTLLDLLLGAHPRMWSLGEAQMLPWQARDPEARCACGRAFAGCDFWSRVLARLDPGAARFPVETFRDAGGSGKVLRRALLPALLLGRWSAQQESAAAEYGVHNARLLGLALAEVERRRGSAPRFLVDASKDPYRLLWLARSGLFDLRVVQIVKDPRAFTYSMIKRDLSARPARVLRYSVRWLVEGFLFERLRATCFASGGWLRLRYEDLAARPELSLELIGEWLGLEMPEDLIARFRAAECHAVTGNRMRSQDGPIRLDDEWRRALPRRYARLAWTIAGPMRRRLGYC